jgi:hypothetical protein
MGMTSVLLTGMIVIFVTENWGKVFSFMVGHCHPWLHFCIIFSLGIILTILIMSFQINTFFFKIDFFIDMVIYLWIDSNLNFIYFIIV